ncbi:ABC transporter permease [Pseudonocardia acaciae]|uniref:ABC transporter permease n=1 Tax=Pseudonocardia acaciae TaxID=551276 RepID=UPI000490A018|nr:ABC transporter permease [Pseudonocardia acaciae]
MTALTHDRAPLRLRRRRLPVPLRRPLALTGMVILAVWLVAMLGAPLLTQYTPDEPSTDLFAAPSGAHWFGTDELGRDVFTRVVFGARISLPLSALLVAFTVLAGGLIGAVAGYFGGWVDGVLMRVVDIVFAFPAIVLAMVVTAALGPGLHNAVLALALVTWPTYARVVRGLVLSATHSDYVYAVRLMSGSSARVLGKDVLPNVVGPVLVLATMDVGNAVLLLAGLSFLGLGAQPPEPEWGSMVSVGADYFNAWWIGVFPGLAIVTVVISFNFLGDSVRDAIDRTGSWGERA